MSSTQATNAFFEVVYSTDDAGFYCVVMDRSGQELHVTDVYKARCNAIAAAKHLYPEAMFVSENHC